jgi:hypothetical protein
MEIKEITTSISKKFNVNDEKAMALINKAKMSKKFDITGDIIWRE